MAPSREPDRSPDVEGLHPRAVLTALAGLTYVVQGSVPSPMAEAIESVLGSADSSSSSRPTVGVGSRVVRRLTDAVVHVYHRHEVRGERSLPDTPCLVVSNRGLGIATDLDVLALYATLRRLGEDRATATLVHQLAWTVGLGPVLESLDCRPAGETAAGDALAEGRHVLVVTGRGPASSRGFAQVAVDAGVPVVPIVTVGGLLRHLPLPTRLVTTVLPAMWARPDESSGDLARRVEAAMQAAQDEIVLGRRPLWL